MLHISINIIIFSFYKKRYIIHNYLSITNKVIDKDFRLFFLIVHTLFASQLLIFAHTDKIKQLSEMNENKKKICNNNYTQKKIFLQ